MASAQAIGDIHELFVKDPGLGKRTFGLIANNFDQYTEPYNLLPHWLSRATGGTHVSAAWVVSNFMPVAVAVGATGAIVRVYMSKDSPEKREEMIGNIQTALTIVSVSYALFTLGRMQYAVRVGADRLFITTAAFLEYALSGRVDPAGARLVRPDLFARLPRRVRDAFSAGALKPPTSLKLA